VWRGLVADPTAKHYRKLDGALWLLLYFILHADRGTGALPYKFSTIRRTAGFPRRTIQRWLGRLRREGYVNLERRGNVRWVSICRWKATATASRVARDGATSGAPARHS
jgi:DNA-binding transcriptional ArsR family regulator